MKRRARRNPRADDLLWAYGTAGLGELKAAGASAVTLPLIVKAQALEESGEYGVVSMYDAQNDVLLVAVVSPGGPIELLHQDDGMFELADRLLSLHRAGKLDTSITKFLRQRLVSAKREARPRLYAADVAELIAAGLALAAGW